MPSEDALNGRSQSLEKLHQSLMHLALKIRRQLMSVWDVMQIKSLRPKEMSNKRLSRPAKTVHRIYGGHLSHRVVKDRIVRAFLIEEQKIIKKVRF